MRVRGYFYLILGSLLATLFMASFAILAEEPEIGKLVYSDNFTTRKESGWTSYADDNYSMLYKDGEYHIQLFKKSSSYWSFSYLDLQNYVAEVRATQVGGPDDNAYGLVFRKLNTGNYSLFLVSGDGFYGFSKKENSQWVVPLKWIKSDAIKTGNSTNVLKVVCDGEKISLYANGVKLADYTDNKPVSGDIGFWVESIVEEGVHVSFDDLRVWEVK